MGSCLPNYLMDDQGLVSSVIYYQDGQAIYRLPQSQRLSLESTCKMGGVSRSQSYLCFSLKKEAYQDMGDLSCGVFEENSSTP